MVSYLSEIAAVVWQQGYARGTIHLHLRAIDQFGAWLLKEQYRTNRQVTPYWAIDSSTYAHKMMTI
jgi:hypothetical protein